jgi:hypothetical protein
MIGNLKFFGSVFQRADVRRLRRYFYFLGSFFVEDEIYLAPLFLVVIQHSLHAQVLGYGIFKKVSGIRQSYPRCFMAKYK